MAERTQYTPGTFSWTDLTTTDQDAAKTFYGGLFGWHATDLPAGEGVVYSMMSLDDREVAAISPQPAPQREAGVPPTWNSYVTVESADQTLDRAKELGATVHAPAFDVFEAGRMGVVQDPQGAFFMAWQPNTHIGASLVNAPGALAWNELATPNMVASAEFYAGLFGWTTEPFEGSEMPYLVIKNAAGQTNGGIRPTMEPERPYWLVYFGTADIEAGLARVGELGGSTLAGPVDIGAGKIGVVSDPQGAVFGLYAGRFDS